MAEGHIGTAFGALGALDVLVQRCTQGYAFWQRIDNVTESMRTFKIRLDMQCATLAYWAQEWGIGKNLHTKDQKFLIHEPTVINYLKLIDRIIYDLNGLDSSFPSLSTAQNLTSTDRRRHVDEVGSSISVEIHDSDKTDLTSIGFKSKSERLKWALQDEKLNERLTLLVTLIQDLYFLLPPPHSDPAGVIVLGTSLASQDAATLARVSHDIGSAPLQGIAWLKSIAYRMQGAVNGLGSGACRLKKGDLKECSSKQGKSLRFKARYNGCSVFVEQKSCTVPRNDSDQLKVLEARIENIVLRLQDPLKPAELRTLPCLGIIESQSTIADDAITSICSIVYKMDMPHFFSLQEILSQRRRSEQDIQIRRCFPLGRRFVVAQTLARAVMYLHFTDWLHKAIRSDNVLFFAAKDMADLGSASPYLVGFEYSRPDALGEQTENIVEEEGHKFYRHPKAQVVPVADFQQPLGGAGRYSKAYDIYSLGVTLVELGLFRSADRIVADRLGSNADPSTTDIQDIFIKVAIPKLRFSMGETYANAACICLDGSFDNLDRACLEKEFYKEVVLMLELCSA